MKNSKIRFGMIGAGHIGRYHVQQLCQLKDVSLVGVFDINKTNAQKVGINNNVEIYNSLNDLLKNCDAVSIATPAKAHKKVAVLALEAGCHTFIEKPLALNLVEATDLVELSIKHMMLYFKLFIMCYNI